jgi:hypothetical protein
MFSSPRSVPPESPTKFPAPFVAPFGSVRAALTVLPYYPSECLESKSIYCPVENKTIFELFGKLGVERMGGNSAAHEKVIFLFDLVPCRKKVKTYHHSSLPPCDKA